jgi:hypothetical protein
MILLITISNVVLVTNTSLGLVLRALISVGLGMTAVALVQHTRRHPRQKK